MIRRPRPVVASAVLAAAMITGIPGAAEAGFVYHGRDEPKAAAADDGPETRAKCGFASRPQDLPPPSLRTAHEGTPLPDARHSFWLNCGESLVAALARWGARHGVMVTQPAGGTDWRVVTPYRFRAASFAGALAELRTRLAHLDPRPVLRFDTRNRVLLVLGEDRQ